MITMADSITPANLPGTYDAYLGYVDGNFQTVPALRARFPRARLLTLTVLGGNAVADGCDREPGDLSAVTAVAWAKRRIEAGEWRPVIYASASNMAPVLAQMAADGVGRSQVRLLSAHYGAGEHICGPATCRQTSLAMDGTQWTDSAPGAGGTRIDASVLVDGFFGAVTAAPSDWQEAMMNKLPTLTEGDTDGPGQTRFVHRAQALVAGVGAWNSLGTVTRVTADGHYGPGTKAGVAAVQRYFGLTADGVCGPKTWAALVTG